MAKPSRTKTHALRSGGSGIRVSVCGMVAVHCGPEVTCALCIRELRSLDRVGAATLVVADTGGTEWDETLAPIAEAEVPGRVEHAYRWTSELAALETWARTRMDGYSAKSLHAVTEALGRDGCRVQDGGRSEPKALRQADDVAEVERVLRHVFGTLAWEGLLDANLALTALLWRFVASGWAPVRKRGDVRLEAVQMTPEAIAERLDMPDVTARIVKRTTDRARRLVRVELVARGLVRPRRRPGADAGVVAWEREQEAVRERRAAMEARR